MDFSSAVVEAAPGVMHSFDLVSADRTVVGNAKWYKNLKVPASKWLVIAEYVWLLQHLKGSETKFTVFGPGPRGAGPVAEAVPPARTWHRLLLPCGRQQGVAPSVGWPSHCRRHRTVRRYGLGQLVNRPSPPSFCQILQRGLVWLSGGAPSAAVGDREVLGPVGRG